MGGANAAIHEPDLRNEGNVPGFQDSGLLPHASLHLRQTTDAFMAYPLIHRQRRRKPDFSCTAERLKQTFTTRRRADQ